MCSSSKVEAGNGWLVEAADPHSALVLADASDHVESRGVELAVVDDSTGIVERHHPRGAFGLWLHYRGQPPGQPSREHRPSHQPFDQRVLW